MYSSTGSFIRIKLSYLKKPKKRHHILCFQVYAMIGQRHSGFMGMFQRALSRGSSHIWFERTEARDRAGVSERLLIYLMVVEEWHFIWNCKVEETYSRSEQTSRLDFS